LDDNFAEPNLDGGITSTFDFRLADIFLVAAIYVSLVSLSDIFLFNYC